MHVAQVAQDAQAGDACDYCNKRQPMTFNEVKECCNGFVELSRKLQGERVDYIRERHATRLMCDSYGKGIVRGQCENTNLRAHAEATDFTHAESYRTSHTEALVGSEYLTGYAAAADPFEEQYCVL